MRKERWWWKVYSCKVSIQWWKLVFLYFSSINQGLYEELQSLICIRELQKHLWTQVLSHSHMKSLDGLDRFGGALFKREVAAFSEATLSNFTSGGRILSFSKAMKPWCKYKKILFYDDCQKSKYFGRLQASHCVAGRVQKRKVSPLLPIQFLEFPLDLRSSLNVCFVP